MGLFRIRRMVPLLPGARLSLSAASASIGWRNGRATLHRPLLSTLPPETELPASDKGRDGLRENPQPGRPTSMVALLIGGVLVLWLLLSFMGHR
jgi:hypothetical protein